MSSNYIPFTYLVGWSKHNIWYYGARVKPGTTPSDLWTKYFTSSKLVKTARIELGEPDIIQVRKTFTSKEQTLLWEHKVLRRLKVKKHPRWLNQSTGLGDNHYIGPHSEETKNKESNTRKKRLAAGIIIPSKHTEEHKRRLREQNPGGEATAKPIYQIDANTGNVIKMWKSSRSAGLGLGIKSWRNISRVASHKPRETVGGFFWRWIGDASVVNNKLLNISDINHTRLDRSSKAGKAVQQIDESGVVIATWKNMCEASRQTGIHNAYISLAVKHNVKKGGFYWKLV
jgi:hypothetical protein